MFKLALFLQRNKRVFTLIYVLFLSLLTTPVYASSFGGVRLIQLMQQATFWLGMAITIWGCVEMQLDYPGWKGRVFKGVLGYILILVIPLVFLELRKSLYVDVWKEIEKEGGF